MSIIIPRSNALDLALASKTLLRIIQRAHHNSTTMYMLATAKYVAYLLLLLNIRSFPLVWHFRLFRAFIQLGLSLQWHKLTHFYLRKAKRLEALRDWYEKDQPIGVHPFRKEWGYRHWVGPDDADFYLHMSNSAYPKIMDIVRFQLAPVSFPNLFRTGGWVALAATHFSFVREIPMFSTYEVRASIGAWDDKWLWCVCRFVKPPSKQKSKSEAKSEKNQAHDADGTNFKPLNGNANDKPNPDTVSRALLDRAARTTEPDGAVLYTVAVSQCCFKQGRITIPPAVVLAANGFYAATSPSISSSTSSTPFSSTSTTSTPSSTSTSSSFNKLKPNSDNSQRTFPPHWPAVRKVTHSASTLRKFYAGGWREERWWEDAFRACEEERRERLLPFVGSKLEDAVGSKFAGGEEGGGDLGTGKGRGRGGGLSGGMEGVRNLVVVPA
ncbi:peptidase A1 domain-containing protein [Favolaschia claudopus]|uniref:Peptidase A1 domain-containing protein n=1 Tax=Favolaschia claudopus TaxID=2862362 RepID=A0AAW0A764_9AGAR